MVFLLLIGDYFRVTAFSETRDSGSVLQTAGAVLTPPGMLSPAVLASGLGLEGG